MESLMPITDHHILFRALELCGRRLKVGPGQQEVLQVCGTKEDGEQHLMFRNWIPAAFRASSPSRMAVEIKVAFLMKNNQPREPDDSRTQSPTPAPLLRRNLDVAENSALLNLTSSCLLVVAAHVAPEVEA